MAMRDSVSIFAMLTGAWREARVAILAFKGLLACMGPPMSIQAGLEPSSSTTAFGRSKSAILVHRADQALEWHLSSVHPIMYLLSCVGPLVYLLMSFHVVGPCECLATS